MTIEANTGPTNDDKNTAKSLLAWVEAYCAHDDKGESFVAKAVEAGIVAGPDHVGEFTPNEAALDEFKARVLGHWARTCYQPQPYELVSEAEGTIKHVAKGSKKAAVVKAHYAVSLTRSDMAKLKGKGDDVLTIRGLITSVRDAANEYVGQKYRRLCGQAVKASGTKAAPREFWTYFADETAKLGKRAKKDGVCSETEFRVALKAFETKLRSSAPKT